MRAVDYQSVGQLSHPEYDQVFYLRLIEACNMHCEHCFIPKNPNRMTHQQVDSAVEHIKRTVKQQETVLIQFHGGEPLLYGADSLRRVIRKLRDEINVKRLDLSIQTNLSLFNEDIAELLTNDFDEVGVSWDVDIRKLRKEGHWSSDAFESVFWPNLRELQSAGAKPYLIMTATKPFFDYFRSGLDLMVFLRDKCITHAHIERLTPTGYARSNWNKIGVSNQKYAKEMSRLYLGYILWQQKHVDELRISVSPFDGLTLSVRSLRSGRGKGYGCWSGHCDNHFHTIDANGYQPGCTALTANKQHNAKNIIQFMDKRATRQVACQDCQFRPICSSGCLELTVNDLSGECPGSYTLFETVNSVLSTEVQDGQEASG